MSAFPEYDCFRIKTACEIVVLLAGVGFCARLAVPRCSETAFLHDGQLKHQV